MYSVMARKKHTSATYRSLENFKFIETAKVMRKWYTELYGESIIFSTQKF